MARSTSQASSLEAKALKAESKSEGMRMLFEAGYEVTQVRDIFEVPYGFAYGVAVRGGFVEPEPREAKPKAEKAKTAPARTAKAAPAKAPARAAKAAPKAAAKTAARRTPAKA